MEIFFLLHIYIIPFVYCKSQTKSNYFRSNCDLILDLTTFKKKVTKSFGHWTYSRKEEGTRNKSRLIEETNKIHEKSNDGKPGGCIFLGGGIKAK